MSATTVADPERTYLQPSVQVRRWPGERGLFAACVAVSLVLWVLLTVSIVGLVYALFIALFFFVMHLMLIAHVRGNSVRIGPDQFPELHERIQNIALTIGMKKVPAAYLLQGGGTLNAFATRFARSQMIVLFSDLLEACGDNTAARDMIIGHELGHIHAGHLRWRWLTLPAAFVPFLGTALSRAREYTCDRFGLVAANDQEGALLGLTILAAGGTHARDVNRASFVAQRAELNTGWMRIGEWLSTHPPLARRIVALDPRFGRVGDGGRAGTLRAVGIVAAILLATATVTAFGVAKVPSLLRGAVNEAEEAEEAAAEEPYTPPEFDVAIVAWNRAVDRLSSFIAAEVQGGRPIPADYRELELRWQDTFSVEAMPLDPFDGSRPGYDRTPEGYVIWSSGPDQQPYTHDDIVRRFDLTGTPSATVSGRPMR